MKKSRIIKSIALGISGLLGLGGAITTGVISTNSPSINKAEAATYGLHVGNVEVTSENLTIDSSDTTDIKSGSATYNPETKTLTLDNFNYQGAGFTGAWQAGVIDRRDDDLTILLKGNNSILKQNDNSVRYSYGIYFNGEGKSLTIDEDSEGGSLEISFWADRSGGKSNGIFLEPGSFVMNGGTVVSNAGRGDESAGIYADNGITFNGGSFTGRGYYTTAHESRGIYSPNNITINGGEVYGYAPLDNSYTAYAYDNYNINFISGELYAEGKIAFKSPHYVTITHFLATTILGGDSEATATEQTNLMGGFNYYHISFVHEHNWSYTADGASITAECHNSGCSINTGLTLTVSDPADTIYDGTAKDIQLNSYNKKVFDTPEIKYYKDGVEVEECINAGTYEARVSANGQTAIKSFSITKADGTLTPPTAKPIIAYTGSAQELVNAGSTSDGTIYYRLGDGEYSTNIPTAIEPGTYNVYYKLIGDDNHNDGLELGPIESNILNGVATVTTGTTTTVYEILDDALAAWNSADAGATLTLLNDVTVSSTTTISSSKILDLNGYGIRMTNTNSRIFNFTGGGLTINDSNPSHAHAVTLSNWRGTSISDGSGTTNVDSNGTGTVYITGGYITGAYVTSSSVGTGAAFKFNNSNIVINGGTIIGNYINYNGCTGAAFYITNSYLTMNGGSIEYNYSQNDAAALSVESSTVEINSGSISHNRSDWAGGAAISGGINHTTFTLKLYGGHIEENVSMHNDGNVLSKFKETENTTFEIKGSPTIQNNSISQSGTNTNFVLCNKINVVGALTDGARIGVTLTGTCGGEWSSDGTGSFTEGWSTYMGDADPADYFFSNDPNYYIYLKDGEAYCDEAPAAKVQNEEVTTYYENFSDAVSTWNSADAGATLTLLKDATISTAIVVNDNSNKVLDLNGFTLSGTPGSKQAIVYVNGGTLTINGKDISGNMGTLCNGSGYYDGSYTRGGAVAIYAGGEVTINDCNIADNECNFAGAIFISAGTTATLNNCNVYNNITNNTYGYRGVIYAEGVSAKVYINGGEIYNNSAGVYLFNGAENSSPYAKLNGVYIHDNQQYGVAVERNDNGNPALTIAGDTIIINNSTATTSGARANLRINSSNGAKIAIDSELGLGDNASIGITLTYDTLTGDGTGIFTDGWSTYMEGKKPADYFFSDNSNYQVYLKDGEAYLGARHTVTFNTNGRGTAPDPVIVDDGLLVNKPTDPTVEGYELKGWYKEAECENIWDFDNDTVTEDIILYALWDYDATTYNVINLINDIGTLTYDGGSNDSLADILAAKTAYDALTPGRKVIVDGVNKDVLDHDITTYNNVDKVGDLIKAIPEPNPTKEYYDAIDLAITEYNKLTEEEVIILNTKIDFEKFLNDNKAARKVIIEIEEIGEVTYDGGIDDSRKDIEKAEKSYDELSKDQKDIVDNVNHDVLVEDREIYDQMDKAIKAIKEIGKVENNEETKEKIQKARKIYDSLPEELQEFVEQYEDSLKVLEDDEKVLDVLVLIDDIGDVNYDSDSQEKIQKARMHYDSLTDDQKRLIAPEALEKLEEIEATYTSLNNTGNVLLVIFLIISGLLLILGLIVMYFIIRKKKEDGDDDSDNSSDKSETTKLASFTGLMPFIIYTSHYLDPGYILLYIIIALTVIVWLTNLVLFILKKKGLLNKKKEETKPIETVEEPEPAKPVVKAKEPEPVNEEEVVTITDEKGNIFNIRYIKSFTAKLIQSPEETKKYYEELKNYVLSYKKTTSRISWHYDSVNSGRNQVLKFAIRGKTLCVYYPLNADDYNDTKYKVEAVESKKFEEVPCLYRIKNDRRLGYAKDLIDTVMTNLGLVKGEEQHEVYSDLPYEENRPLIARGLIKELKIQVNKPVEHVVSKKVDDEGDEIVTTRDAKGNIFEIRYIKSFTAKLSQASEEVKDYYNELKNYALSYKKANSRVSWHFDSINVGRSQVIKFSIRGKTLCVYYALNANDYLATKYKVEVVESKKFEEVPCLYRIKNDRRRDYAKDLIDAVMASVPTEKGKESNEDFRIPYESTKALLAKGLIKENKVQVNKPVVPAVIKAEEVDVKMSDEEAASQIKEDSGSIKHIGKKGIVNIDVIAKSFANNEVVNIESLREKKIISKNIGYVKVLARGSLDKKLNFELQDYSLQAVKMILLAGGTVKRVK